MTHLRTCEIMRCLQLHKWLQIFPESSLSHPLSLTIDNFSSNLPPLHSTRLLTIDHGQLKFVACPSIGHKTVCILSLFLSQFQSFQRVPRMNPLKGLTQFTLPPPRPEAPQYISRVHPNGAVISHSYRINMDADRRLSYCIPPSNDQSSISSANSSLSIGERYHSASTIPQDPSSNSDAPIVSR